MDGSEAPLITRLRVTPEAGRQAPKDAGHPSARVLSHGSMEVRWYAPEGEDRQHPHDRDEVYVVVSGTGTFVRAAEGNPFDDTALPVCGEERVPFEPGDVLFVPAGTVHRFEGFSSDFATWAVFYGPEGGER